MKIHRNLAEAVVQILKRVFDENKVAEREVEAALADNKKWGARDRSFVAETVYEIVRWRRLLAHTAQSHDVWPLLGAELVRREVELPPWDEFEALNANEIRARLNDSDLPRAVRESVPDWLDELGHAQLGARWDAEMVALNQSAPVVLRANTLKNSRDELQTWLRENNVETEVVSELPDALRLQKRANLSRLLREGRFEVQDAGSQLVAPFLEVEPKMNVVDAAAGAGGKTLHLGALMQNSGRILALDVDKRKLNGLDARAKRAGLSNVQSRVVQPSDTQKFANSADRLLIDAPCSGLGTLRRQPDLKWRLSLQFLENVRAKQREILEFYAPMLRSGGKMVYATCSILPSENEEQIAWFVERHPQFELEEQKRVWTSETGWDGFFMARLRRQD